MTPMRSIHILLMAIVLCAGSNSMWGQSPYDPYFYPDAFLIRDHLEVFTDRSIYVVEETIHFRADHRTDGVAEAEPWSTVLYVELVTSGGDVVSQGKYALSAGESSGSIHIPAGTLTGNYYVKCYTRWMRNSGPRSFSYIPVKVVNPFNLEVVNHAGGDLSGQTTTRREYMTGYMECAIERPSYGQGEEVRLLISGNLMNRLPQLSCCLTVVPAGAIDLDRGQINFYGSTINPGDYRVNYLPDLKGVSLSGRVVDAGQGTQPISSANLYFSLLGDNPDYLVTITDKRGRFVISTPDRTGIQEFFVAPDPSFSGEAEIRIDQDFDESKMPLPAAKFALSSLEHEVATQMAVQMQLSAVFDTGIPAITSPAEDAYRGRPAFYGTPAFSILMEDFVALPTLEEVFINLVPTVEITVKRGQRSLWVTGPNSAINLYRPLIMIDHIPVFDQQAVLGINPEKILKVDVINEVYVKGNIAHGGVISIFSRNGDMAGIDLAKNSYFFDYKLIKARQIQSVPVYALGDHVPDLRTTVLWLDDVLLERGSPCEISFNAPSTPGDYVILIRGLAHQGSVISATARFSVF